MSAAAASSSASVHTTSSMERPPFLVLREDVELLGPYLPPEQRMQPLPWAGGAAAPDGKLSPLAMDGHGDGDLFSINDSHQKRKRPLPPPHAADEPDHPRPHPLPIVTAAAALMPASPSSSMASYASAFLSSSRRRRRGDSSSTMSTTEAPARRSSRVQHREVRFSPRSHRLVVKTEDKEEGQGDDGSGGGDGGGRRGRKRANSGGSGRSILGKHGGGGGGGRKRERREELLPPPLPPPPSSLPLQQPPLVPTAQDAVRKREDVGGGVVIEELELGLPAASASVNPWWARATGEQGPLVRLTLRRDGRRQGCVQAVGWPTTTEDDEEAERAQVRRLLQRRAARMGPPCTDLEGVVALARVAVALAAAPGQQRELVPAPAQRSPGEAARWRGIRTQVVAMDADAYRHWKQASGGGNGSAKRPASSPRRHVPPPALARSVWQSSLRPAGVSKGGGGDHFGSMPFAAAALALARQARLDPSAATASYVLSPTAHGGWAQIPTSRRRHPIPSPVPPAAPPATVDAGGGRRNGILQAALLASRQHHQQQQQQRGLSSGGNDGLLSKVAPQTLQLAREAATAIRSHPGYNIRIPAAASGLSNAAAAAAGGAGGPFARFRRRGPQKAGVTPVMLEYLKEKRKGEIERLQRHYRHQTYLDSGDEQEYEVLMVYHDAGLEEDGPHALVRNKASGALRCRPPVSLPGYLARKLPLPPFACQQQQHQGQVSSAPPPTPSPRLLQQQGHGQRGQDGPANTQRWAVTARHFVPGPRSKERQYVTVEREDSAGGPCVCGPLITPSNDPVEVGTTFVLPRHAALPTAASSPSKPSR